MSSTIPESVLTDEIKKATGASTIEELKAFMVRAVASDGITTETSVVVDVEVEVSFDGGNTWVKATEENFPTDGVDVLLPYPENVDTGKYDFVIAHLVVMNCNGMKPGELEYLSPEETDEGLKVHIMSASPFVIGWYEAEDDDEDGGYYVPTTALGNKYSELPIINHTGIRMVVTSDMATAKAAAGITNDEYIKVEIDPLQGDNAAVKLIEALAAQYKLTVSGYCDVNVYRVAANGARLERLTNLNRPVDLLFAVPEGLDGNLYDFGVIRVHDGVAELLKDTDGDPITISVASDKFSAYAIVYGAKGSLVSVKGGVKGGISKAGNQASPKTFDQSRFVPEVPETALAEFTQKQAEQEVADLLITPQATKFPFAVVIVAILALAAFVGGEVFYLRRKKRN